MTLQTGQQIITTYILSNISRSKDNQAMEFDQVVKCNVENINFQKSCKNVAGRLLSDLFLFVKEALHKVKASSQDLKLYIL